MFEATTEPMTTGELARLVGALARLEAEVDDAERVDQLRLLEELKSAAAAAQAKVTVAFAASQEGAQAAAGVPGRDIGKGVAAQVALARRESPARARRHVGWSRILLAELPHTFAALQAGRTTEWRAQLVARETAWLSLEHRRQLDEDIAASLESWGDRRVEAEVRRRAYRLDPHGSLARSAAAEADRRVTLRPAPDTMTVVTSLLPVARGVAVFAALRRQADSLRAAGDPRSRGQIMADTLVERVTGQATAAAVPLEVSLVMTDQTLFNTGAASDEPALAEHYGPIPAELARRLVRTAAAEAAALWLRRLYTAPDTGRLVAMESRRRTFDGGLATFLVVRDQTCRTPWCEAPVRHGDHVLPAQHGGPTSADNGQGLCEACNHAKQAPGWRARASGGGAGESVETTTPTGHRYRSRPPDPPQHRHPVRMDLHFRQLVRVA